MHSGCYLRAVEEADKELLFEWTNDEETRRQSFSQAPVTWEEHAAWFSRTQADEACRHWIFMISGSERESAKSAESEYEAGVLRLVRDEEGGSYRISYSIAPAYRGRGYGTVILELAKTWMIAECPSCIELYGDVKTENTASVRCFERAGYERKADGMEDGCQPHFRFYADLRKERVLYFRADGGGKTGIGHLMRCFTIADACREKGMQAVFVSADAEAKGMVCKRGYPCRVLNTDYRNMNAEIPMLLPVLRTHTPVVLDSYFLTEQYMNALRENGHPVVWMDDLAQQEIPADIRINYNLYAERIEPSERAGRVGHTLTPESCRTLSRSRKTGGCLFLYGPSYAPVRPSFCKAEISVREQIRKVLVTTGGSDPLGAGLFFARLLTKLLPETEILAVIGPYAEKKEELRAYAEQEKRVEVIEGCSDLSEVMRCCDLAVTAAGSTLYELCAAGLPTIVYYMADNQRMGAEAFACNTGAVNIGDFRADGFRADAERKLKEAVERFWEASARQELSMRMRELVDGQGAARIAEKLKELAENS